MTPGARIAAAIDILDEILAGTATEQALTGWARRSRFAGSKDRAAIRDHVFDAVRCKRSFAALGGAMSGRGLMIGALRSAGQDPAQMFDGIGHAPPPLDATDGPGRQPEPGAETGDMPDWLWPLLSQSLGADLDAVVAKMRHRAPVHLRVNLRKANLANARAALQKEGIDTEPLPVADTALRVVSGARGIRSSSAYQNGLVELQDAASQAVAAALPLNSGMRVLDYCAGGGGKALAMAARADMRVEAHDIDSRRMKDLPARAARAGTRIRLCNPMSPRGPYDLVLCDAPCSGSGSWRRDPDGKWRLTPDRLNTLLTLQSEILDAASDLVAPGGVLAYATCSLIEAENRTQIDGFLHRHPGWARLTEQVWTPLDGTDGFFLSQLTRPQVDC